jgi:glutathione S-transferase
MRARLAIAASGVSCELREVVLKDKPTSLLAYSPKGTVPVLITPQADIIDESLDIMQWALSQHDPLDWYQSLTHQEQADCETLIAENDGHFKSQLDRYKYADRYPEHPAEAYRQEAEITLLQLEQRLAKQAFLIRDELSWVDMAILPFIRQFAYVDIAWFEQSPYPNIRKWLQQFIDSPIFSQIMHKYPQWDDTQPPTYFP